MSFQTFLLKNILLRLPDSLLIRMSGGQPIEIDGHRLDARLQYLDYQSRKRRRLDTFPPKVARAAYAGFVEMLKAEPEPGVVLTDITIHAGGRHIPARLYRPEDQDSSVPLLMYYHQGGGVIGDIETTNTFCSILAARTKGPVVSVDYRLAPEHPFPAGLNDAISAYEWGLGQAERLGAPPGKAAVGGDSMGGNFAAIICQAMKRNELPQPVLQLLIYPALDMTAPKASIETYGHLSFLPKETMAWFMELYEPTGRSREEWRISPGLQHDLEGLAPAIIVTAGFDAIRDDGPAYARTLKDEMVPFVERRYETLPHGFTTYTDVCPEALRACRDIAGLLAEGYRRWDKA